MWETEKGQRERERERASDGDDRKFSAAFLTEKDNRTLAKVWHVLIACTPCANNGGGTSHRSNLSETLPIHPSRVIVSSQANHDVSVSKD